MPELPEVETIRKDLNSRIVDNKIVDILVKDQRIIKTSFRNFKEILKNSKIKEIKRRGKLLIFVLDKKDKYLLIHLKMTGQLIYKIKDRIVAGGHSEKKTDFDLPNKFTKVVFTFSDKSKLFFNDMRVFGYMKITGKDELDEILKKGFGIEPLTKDFTWDNFLKLFKNRKTSIKALLMNQKLIAGIGNIYADEVCFCAGVRPSRGVDKLNEKEFKKIFGCIEKVLALAIKHRGTTFNHYTDGDGNKGGFVKYLKVFQRNGQKCKKCGSVIKKIKVAGRGTHYCPKCQK